MLNNVNLRFKIVILGEGGVGKTTLSRSFEQNTIFRTTSQTIGIDIHVKHLQFESFPCTIQLWDLGGQEHFKNMGVFPQFCKGAHGALVCFDLTDLETYNKINQWVKLLPDKIPFLLIGTKADLERSDNLLQNEICEWKKSYNCKSFLQTRSDDFESIKNAFLSLISNIIEESYQEIRDYQTNYLNSEKMINQLNGKTQDLYKNKTKEVKPITIQ